MDVDNMQDVRFAECNNNKSAIGSDRKHIVDKMLEDEIALGHYRIVSKRPRIINALGAVEKPGTSDLRLIMDASRPVGRSLNSYADPEHFSLETVDNAVSMLNRGWYQAKIDLKNGYRSVGISERNYECTGIKWKFGTDNHYTYLVDTRLCMGASKSPSIFQRITSAICRMMRHRGFQCIVYLDDFYLCAETEWACQQAYDVLTTLLVSLGFTINIRKSVPPCTRMIFLGIEIDTCTQTMSIPQDKLTLLREDILAWQGKKSASKRSIQSLLGRMNWAAKCVRAARPYMRRFISLIKGLRRPGHRIRLSAAAKHDLAWWASFATVFNGVSFWHVRGSRPNHVAATDASVTGGGAACSDGDFLYSGWESDCPEVAGASINIKELYTILLALRRWGQSWRRSTVHIYTDSNVALYSIRKGAIDNTQGMAFIREIHLISAIYGIHLVMKRIDTKLNYFADALSRFDVSVFAAKAFSMLMNPSLHNCRHVCDPLRHMSADSWFYLLQRWHNSRRY